MEKIIKLTIEEARNLYKNADSNFKAFLETNFTKSELYCKIEDRIQNFEDVLRELNESYDFKLPYQNPKNKEEKAINAQTKLFKITKAYNEGIILDWNNSNQYKYLPYKYFSDGGSDVAFNGWDSVCCFCSGGLYFKSEDLAKDAYNKFKDIYEDFWM